MVKAVRFIIVYIMVLGVIITGVSCGTGTTGTTTTSATATATATATTPATVTATQTTGATATVTMPGSTETPMPVDNVEVIIENYEYVPPSVTISIGTTVTWRNLDSVEHTVTDRNGAFDSGLFGQNETFSQLFIEPGEYDYYCIPHPFMTGKVIVE